MGDNETFFFRKGATTFVSAAITVLVIMAAILFYQQEQATEADKDWVVHTYEVTGHIQLFFNRLKDVELGERGYRITKDAKYLSPYYDALKDSFGNDAADFRLQQHHSVKEELSILRDIAKDNPTQVENIDELSSDVDELLRYWAAAVAAETGQHSNLSTPQDSEFSREDELVGQVHRLVNIMAAEENRLLSKRTENAEANEKKTDLIISCGIFVFYICIIVSIVFYQKSRDKARARLMHYTRELEMNKLALAVSNRQKDAILASTAYILVTTSIDGTVTLMNREAEKALGYEASEILGKCSTIVWHDQKEIEERAKALTLELATTVRPTFDVFVKKLRLGFVEEKEWTLVRKDGSRFPVLLNVTAIKDENDNITGFLNTIKDISERKETERLKGEFISVVSHELRTPLTSIRGSLGLIVGLMSKDLPEKVRQLIEIALSNSERLILLINDILDIDKIAAGEMRFDIRREVVAKLLTQALEANLPYGSKFGVDIKLRDFSPPIAIDVDASRLMQVLSNLISNAVKFSRKGGVVELSATSENGVARISVKDNGAGIPEEFRARIFGKFSQADSSATRASGGTGLGLHITKQIVDHMGGKIGFDSEIGQGTVFWIEFKDMKAPMAEAEERTIKTWDENSRVLICEDDPDIAYILRMQMELAGFSADITHSIGAARKELAHHSYAAMTLDLMFPDENGIDFIRELRADPKRSHLPIIVVSAKTDEGKNTLNGDAFEIVDWLTKPLDEKHLVSALRRATSRRQGGVPTVLHVEDDKDLSKMLEVALHSKANLINAQTIREAKERLAQQSFSLIVLDLGLPDGNGLALLEYMGEHSDTKIPVLVLSADEAPKNVHEIVAAAMVKSRMSETKIVETILSLIQAHTT